MMASTDVLHRLMLWKAKPTPLTVQYHLSCIVHRGLFLTALDGWFVLVNCTDITGDWLCSACSLSFYLAMLLLLAYVACMLNTSASSTC
jgi:hypothetical protein